METIRISKVCKELEISRQTIYNWKKNGKIKTFKSLGGYNFISIDEFNRLLEMKNKLNENYVTEQ